MDFLTLSLLVGTSSASLYRYNDCDSHTATGYDEETSEEFDPTGQYEAREYLEDCASTVTLETCMAAAEAITERDGKLACVVVYKGCNAAEDNECWAYTQTPDVGQQIASWDPRTCNDGYDTTYSGIITLGDNTWEDNIEDCVDPDLPVEETEEDEEDDEDEEEGAATTSFAAATLATIAAVIMA